MILKLLRGRPRDLLLCLVILVLYCGLLVTGFQRPAVPAVGSSSWRASSTMSSRRNPFLESARVYKDGAFDRIWLYLFGTKMAKAAKAKLEVTNPLVFSYDDFVRLSLLLSRGSPATTKAAVLSVLSWLVGPAKVEEGPVVTKSGKVETWRSTVVIERCRYLESTKCKGTCASVCKAPTQEFFGETLGMPVTMTPNFETLECVMRFGQAAPPIQEDVIQTEPCYADCSTNRSGQQMSGMPRRPCPKIPKA